MNWRKIPAVLLALCFLTPSAMPQDASERKSLFGELHIHTRWSFDAYIFIVRATPDDAYEFAKGKPLLHPLGKTYQLSRPLDFMAVTDHAAYLGTIFRGLVEVHELDHATLARHLHGAGGVAPTWSVPEIEQLLNTETTTST